MIGDIKRAHMFKGRKEEENCIKISQVKIRENTNTERLVAREPVQYTVKYMNKACDVVDAGKAHTWRQYTDQSFMYLGINIWN